ncbi:MAG: pseudouridine synthase [Bacteroides sp. SM23_62]|nr:MAG: pseudouridine synthase [Bacteroides sp. SM23_62]
MHQITPHTDFIKGAVLLIDKPVDWSSFDIVKKVRNMISKRLGLKKLKVGHAGTLDPLASGLMIICTGKATKEIESYQGLEKEYIATLYLGASTPSCDLETEVDHTFPTDHISPELIHKILDNFKGESLQVPPVFSAKRIQGRRAYDFARKGEELAMRPQLINISELEMLDFKTPELTLRVKCSKGTYIRALARDIGKALDTGAYLAVLRRTKIGQFSVDDALIPKKIEELLINL